MLARLLKILVLLLAFQNANCQIDQDSVRNLFGVWYDNTVGQETNQLMYSAIYLTALRGRTTHQYFDQRVWQKGSVIMAGQRYDQLPMLFDIELEQLVIKHPDAYRFDGIAIKMEDLESFTLSGHQFRKFPFLGKSGFFEVLYDGNNILLVAKRKKRSSTQKVGVEFDEITSYYLMDKDRLLPMKGLKTLKNLFPNFIDDIKYIKKEKKIRLRIRKEPSIIRFVESLDEKIGEGQ